MNYDVAVVGLGGMGSAILSRCAARGVSAIGVEQFGLGHELGASSGKSRMIRKAYFEDPAYVPLLLRAYDLWRDLERQTGEELLTITGVLMVGEESCEILTGARRAAEQHGLPVEILTRQQIERRFPVLRVRSEEVGLLEPDGGVLVPERAVRAHLSQAKALGAQMRFEVAMERWEATSQGFKLSLSDGEKISTRVLVLTLGPWFKEILASLGVPLRVERNVQAWFSPETDIYDARAFPGFLLERRGFAAPLYGFPDFGEGVKAAFHGLGDTTDAEHLVREIDTSRDVEPIIRAMEEWMPGATGTFLDAKVCMYALTPDQHFIIDHHPTHKDLVLCGGFSGHGFKFASVVGEIGAELAVDGGTSHDIEFLSLRRFESAK